MAQSPPEEPALAPQPQRRSARPRTKRPIYLGRWQDVPIFDLEALAPGQTVEGPAIVEAATTTILLQSSDSAAVTSLGWLDIRVAAP